MLLEARARDAANQLLALSSFDERALIGALAADPSTALTLYPLLDSNQDDRLQLAEWVGLDPLLLAQALPAGWSTGSQDVPDPQLEILVDPFIDDVIQLFQIQPGNPGPSPAVTVAEMASEPWPIAAVLAAVIPVAGGPALGLLVGLLAGAGGLMLFRAARKTRRLTPARGGFWSPGE